MSHKEVREFDLTGARIVRAERKHEPSVQEEPEEPEVLEEQPEVPEEPEEPKKPEKPAHVSSVVRLISRGDVWVVLMRDGSVRKFPRSIPAVDIIATV
jgi:hypothetical protein